jgi:N-acetyl-anhydromuramyl-L-alanine amidase AmpD|tara:strand:- start:1155 stop:1814 length:660 start_codon:yes stop_codon:yes gene_type:complete
MIKKESPNHYNLGGDIVALVLHTTLGSMASTTNWFLSLNSQVSAHFGVDRDGQIVQFVDLNQGAWHAGARKNPSKRAKDVLPKTRWGTLKNPNKSTIGIEFVSGYDIDRDGVLEKWEQLYTPAQMKATARLVIDVIEPELGITFSGHNVLTHKDIASYKPDLEVQRAMFLSVLQQERDRDTDFQPTPPSQPASSRVISLGSNESAVVKMEGEKVVIIKK